MPNISYSFGDLEDAEIDIFLQHHDDALVYYTREYQKFLLSAIPGAKSRYVLAKNQEGICGVLPAIISTHLEYGSVINGLPFYGSHGGPLLAKEFKNNSNIIRGMLDYLFTDIEILSSVTVVENLFNGLDDEVLLSYGLSVIDDRIGQITHLPCDCDDLEDALFKKLHMKTRNAVRKGQKLEQVVSQRSDRESLVWLQQQHEESILALGGMAKPMAIFDNLVGAFGLEDKMRLYVGKINNETVSGLLVLLYKDTVEYFTPVSHPDYRDKQALSDLIFKVMLTLIKEGYKKWNWGGTWRSQEGVYRFKNRWGAEDYPYRYFGKVTDDFKVHDRSQVAPHYPYFYLYKY